MESLKQGLQVSGYSGPPQIEGGGPPSPRTSLRNCMLSSGKLKPVAGDSASVDSASIASVSALSHIPPPPSSSLPPAMALKLPAMRMLAEDPEDDPEDDDGKGEPLCRSTSSVSFYEAPKKKRASLVEPIDLSGVAPDLSDSDGSARAVKTRNSTPRHPHSAGLPSRGRPKRTPVRFTSARFQKEEDVIRSGLLADDGACSSTGQDPKTLAREKGLQWCREAYTRITDYKAYRRERAKKSGMDKLKSKVQSRDPRGKPFDEDELKNFFYTVRIYSAMGICEFTVPEQPDNDLWYEGETSTLGALFEQIRGLDGFKELESNVEFGRAVGETRFEINQLGQTVLEAKAILSMLLETTLSRHKVMAFLEQYYAAQFEKCVQVWGADKIADPELCDDCVRDIYAMMHLLDYLGGVPESLLKKMLPDIAAQPNRVWYECNTFLVDLESSLPTDKASIEEKLESIVAHQRYPRLSLSPVDWNTALRDQSGLSTAKERICLGLSVLVKRAVELLESNAHITHLQAQDLLARFRSAFPKQAEERKNWQALEQLIEDLSHYLPKPREAVAAGSES